MQVLRRTGIEYRITAGSMWSILSREQHAQCDEPQLAAELRLCRDRAVKDLCGDREVGGLWAQPS